MIISIDPGLTTGICVIDNYASPDEFEIRVAVELNWSTRFWFLSCFKAYNHLIKAVVIEEYRLFKHKAADQTNSLIPSVRVIGIVEAYAFEYGLFDKLSYQPSAEIKAYGRYTINILDQHVKQVGGSRHIRDAYRHARKYLKDQMK